MIEGEPAPPARPGGRLLWIEAPGSIERRARCLGAPAPRRPCLASLLRKYLELSGDEPALRAARRARYEDLKRSSTNTLQPLDLTPNPTGDVEFLGNRVPSPLVARA